MMEFTGERFMPSEAGQIRHEHMHRYAWCRALVQGKNVLDIACGEGYGSSMLAHYAGHVVGVDIAAEAVEHARRTYAGQDNLEFREGNAAAIPVQDASIDVVVSFETIEHHDRHEEMLREIQRVLRPDGVLVISSPNRVIYSEQAGYHNEFHVKELDFNELDELLKRHFDQIRYYGHRLAVGSALYALQPSDEARSMQALTDTGTDILERTTQLIDPVYFVAVATPAGVALPSMPSSVLFSEAEDLYTHHREVAAWAQRLSGEITQAHAKSDTDRLEMARLRDSLNQSNELLNQSNESLNQALRETEQVRNTLIETTGVLAQNEARLRAQEPMVDELSQIKSSRSWRWTRPIRFGMRLLRHRGLSALDQEQLRRRLGKQPEAAVEVETDVWLAPYKHGNRDVFVWSVIDWHFRIQRPQHLARELVAAGYRVFYISNNFVDRNDPGFAIEPLDDSGRLFQIKLHLEGSPGIYHAVPTPDAQQQLRVGIGQLLAWTRSRACLSLVQHPYWLEAARVLPNQRLVYDCMDHHGGFANNSPDVLARELDLMRTADLLMVTSDWLYEEASKYNEQRLMVRNACQYEHFATRPEQVFSDRQGRKVIGYYGAIAEWFDLDLVEKLALRFEDCLVLLVGADTSGAQQRLQHLANVQFTGEVPYAQLPFYLHGFDVCLLPFRVIPLTLATNPVKVYEYLSAGKSVVSITLPEIRQFGELVRTGSDHASFIEAVGVELMAGPDPEKVALQQQFAAEQTWSHRAHDLILGVGALPESRVSLVVVTYNNIDLTKICLRSLELYSDYANLEVIVVDNASADGTPAYLTEWAAAGTDRKLILNSDNRGFAAANNQGLAVADGDYLVLLNNDTHVTPGWIATLIAHLRHSKTLGMIGPVTNNIGNEARIDIRYDDMEGMLRAAADYTLRHAGRLTQLRTAAFFCVMMPRAVYAKVGLLDEAFGVGFFEDDDYCRRVEQAGWTIACADDVFVHHNLSASFNKLKQEKRQALFERNKAIYEEKWGAWSPHGYRNNEAAP